MSENTTKTLLPDVQAYFDALEKSRQDFDKAREEVGKRHMVPVLISRYSDEWRTARDAAQAEVAEAENIYNEAPRKAREALAQSSDPLVAWIAKNTLFNYKETSEHVLRMLPASLAEIQEWAETQDFCGTWDTYVAAAEEAGVFAHLPQAPNPVTLTGEAWDKLTRMLDRELYSSQSRIAKRLVREVVRQSLSAQVPAQAEAPVDEPATADTAAE